MTGAKKGSGVYCFTLDDNIRFLQQSTLEHRKRLLEHPYLALLHGMHQKYGAKFQLNMYESYEPGGFSLRQVPDCWRQELEDNAHWLRFSFHARHNAPPFPYETATEEELLADYAAVMEQMHRIAGRAATDATTTIHYVSATREACAALKEKGIRGLIGMFYPKAGREALRYYLTREQAEVFRDRSFWYDPQTGLHFARNDLVINTVPLEAVIPHLEGLPASDFYHVMIHEQYFYPDYVDYQPDFGAKVEAPLRWFQSRGMRSCFLEELL